MELQGIHPERWADGPPWRREMLRLIARGKWGLWGDRDGQRRMDQLRAALSKELLRKGIEPGRDDPRGTPLSMGEFMAAMSVADFRATGRNVLRVPDHVAEMLRRTSIDELGVTDLRLPFPSFYVWFDGPGIAATTAWGESARAEGAYVQRLEPTKGATDNGALLIRTVLRTGEEGAWPRGSGGVTNMLLPVDGDGVSLSFAVEEALRLHAQVARDEGDSEFEVRWSTKAIAGNTEDLRAVLTVVANAIVFVGAMPGEMTRDLSGLPDRLREDLSSGDNGRVLRAERKIRERGYSRVMLVGGSIPPRPDGAVTGRGSEKAPHWRRGHWRRQRYGQDYGSVRLVWIQPMLVRADSGQPRAGKVVDLELPAD